MKNYFLYSVIALIAWSFKADAQAIGGQGGSFNDIPRTVRLWPTSGGYNVLNINNTSPEELDYKVISASGAVVLKGVAIKGISFLELGSITPGLYYAEFNGRQGGCTVIKFVR
jgi:hypothetical protein